MAKPLVWHRVERTHLQAAGSRGGDGDGVKLLLLRCLCHQPQLEEGGRWLGPPARKPVLGERELYSKKRAHPGVSSVPPPSLALVAKIAISPGLGGGVHANKATCRDQHPYLARGLLHRKPDLLSAQGPATSGYKLQNLKCSWKREA